MLLWRHLTPVFKKIESADKSIEAFEFSFLQVENCFPKTKRGKGVNMLLFYLYQQNISFKENVI